MGYVLLQIYNYTAFLCSAESRPNPQMLAIQHMYEFMFLKVEKTIILKSFLKYLYDEYS